MAHLSPLQKEIVCLLPGRDRYQIADRLGISHGTLNRRLGELFLELNARSQTELVITALRHGYVTFDDLECPDHVLNRGD